MKRYIKNGAITKLTETIHEGSQNTVYTGHTGV